MMPPEIDPTMNVADLVDRLELIAHESDTIGSTIRDAIGTIRVMAQALQACASAAANSGPPINAVWRANGPDGPPDVDPVYLVKLHNELMAVVTVFENGYLSLNTVEPWLDYAWDDVAWFVPIDEIAPTLPE